MAVTSDFEPQSAVKRELILRVASLLWRLRRATAIETGLFKMQARQLLKFRQRRPALHKRQQVIDDIRRDALAGGGRSSQIQEVEQASADLTQSFMLLGCPGRIGVRFNCAIWIAASRTFLSRFRIAELQTLG